MTGRSGSKDTCGFLVPHPPGQRFRLNIKAQDHSKPRINKRKKEREKKKKKIKITPRSMSCQNPQMTLMWRGLGGIGPKTPNKKSQKQRKTALEAGIWVGRCRRAHHRVSGPLHSDILTTLSISGPHTAFRESVTLSHPDWSLPEYSSYRSWIYGLRLGRDTFGAKRTQARTRRQNVDAVPVCGAQRTGRQGGSLQR